MVPPQALKKTTVVRPQARPVSRKERRKQERKDKKAAKHAYLLQKVGKAVPETPKPTAAKNVPKPALAAAPKSPSAGKPAKKEKKKVSFSEIDAARKADRKSEIKLKRDYEVVRKKNLFHDNKLEDKEIRKLERKLKLHKRKKKSLPQSFVVDGLDYLLDICDPSKLKELGQSGTLDDSGSEFEEDFRALTSRGDQEKATKSKKKSGKSDAGADPDVSEDEEAMGESDVEDGGVEEHRPSSKRIDLSSNSDISEEEEPAPKKIRKEKFEREERRVSMSEDSEISEDENEEEEAEEEGSEVDEALVDEDDEEEGSENEENLVDEGEGSENEAALVNEDPEEDEERSDEEMDHPGSSDEELGDSEEEEAESKSSKPSGEWEDIYGRTRDVQGNVINTGGAGKYVPPAKRAELEGNSSSAAFLRLKRQLNGLLNRLSEVNVASIEKEIVMLFSNNSRNDMSRALNSLLMDSLVMEAQTPEKLIIEPAMLMGILHVDVGSEVGATFVETLVKKFDEIHSSGEELRVEDRRLDNLVLLLSHLHNFRVIHSSLLYDILKCLCQRFSEKDVELIMVILRAVGFSLRKQDPAAMKDLIVAVKEKANEKSGKDPGPRVKFMLEALLAVKNNNTLKMPNYDPELVTRLQKTMKMLTQGKATDELKITMRDLLEADKRGKWWIVGSAWTGKLPGETLGSEGGRQGSSGRVPQVQVSQEILDLARKQRMNTDIRKNIFCVIMTSADYLDAFEKLIKLGLNKHQDRELVVVAMDCCLQEKVFNPFYAHLVHRFCDYDRRFQLATQFTFWDRIKAVGDLEPWQLRNLAKFLALLFLKRGLPISVLKAIQFADLDKKMVRLVRQILMSVLLTDTFDEDAVRDVFERVAVSSKLQELRESLKLFMHHFLLKNKSKLTEEQSQLLEERVAMAEKALAAGQKKLVL